MSTSSWRGLEVERARTAKPQSYIELILCYVGATC
jgi:hypothetical protein